MQSTHSRDVGAIVLLVGILTILLLVSMALGQSAVR